MTSKSSKWELGFVHYITKFTISRFVISRFECTYELKQGKKHKNGERTFSSTKPLNISCSGPSQQKKKEGLIAGQGLEFF